MTEIETCILNVDDDDANRYAKSRILKGQVIKLSKRDRDGRVTTRQRIEAEAGVTRRQIA